MLSLRRLAFILHSAICLSRAALFCFSDRTEVLLMIATKWLQTTLPCAVSCTQYTRMPSANQIRHAPRRRSGVQSSPSCPHLADQNVPIGPQTPLFSLMSRFQKNTSSGRRARPLKRILALRQPVFRPDIRKNYGPERLPWQRTFRIEVIGSPMGPTYLIADEVPDLLRVRRPIHFNKADGRFLLSPVDGICASRV